MAVKDQPAGRIRDNVNQVPDEAVKGGFRASRGPTQEYQTEKLMLAGAPPGRWDMPTLPAHAFLIHGEKDDVAPLSDVFVWLEPQNLALYVVPNCDHYFNGKLLILKRYINQYLLSK